MATSNIALLHNFVQPMPATAKDMQDVMKRDHVLLDEVDVIHVILYDTDPAYRLLLAAIDRGSSVSGATTTDDVLAALKIKAYAHEHGGFPLVEAAREHQLMLLMRRVAKKYNISRKQRKEAALARYFLSQTPTNNT